MSAEIRPNIAEFNDYRDFLEACFEAKKAVNPKVSYQYVARKIDATRSYFKLLTQKKRQATLHKVNSLAKLFRLNDDERQYLTFLFLKNTSKDPELEAYFESVLDSLRKRREVYGGPDSLRVSLTEAGYEEARSLLETARNRIIELSQQSQSTDRVYSGVLSLSPVDAISEEVEHLDQTDDLPSLNAVN